jgi:hypothetical protein
MHANKNRRNCNSASAISLDAPKHRLATARIIHTFFELSNYSRRERGSSASRKLSPRKLNARMINICAMRTHWSIHVRYQLHRRHLADCRILCKIISAQCGIWKLAKELIGMPNQLELLQEKVETAATPREKIDALNLLAYELRDVDGKHSLDLAQIALNLAQPIAIDRQPILLTLSAGIATWASQEDNLDAVIARADQALYRAKQAGRNRVVAESAGS